jgi:hypothetical protein
VACPSSCRDSHSGDYGYIPEGSTDFANFVRLGNIQDGPGEDRKAKGMMEVVGKTHGTMLLRSSSHGMGSIPQRQPANAFLLLDELECWPVTLPPRGNATAFVHHEAGLTSVNDAWQFLIACGASLASTHGIQRKAVVDMLARRDEDVCFIGGVILTSFQVYSRVAARNTADRPHTAS